MGVHFLAKFKLCMQIVKTLTIPALKLKMVWAFASGIWQYKDFPVQWWLISARFVIQFLSSSMKVKINKPGTERIENI